MEHKRNYALVTGATSGFGYEFSKLLAKDGHNLFLVARSSERLDEISADISKNFMVDVIPFAVDLFDPSAAIQVYETATVKGITVDVLINDAGQGEHGHFLDYDLARDMDMIQLNIISLVSLTKLFLKDMVARNEGRILQVASLLGKYPTPYMSVYAATKAFVISFTEGLIHELKETKVTLTALLPGASDTDFFHKAGGEESKTYKEDTLSKPEDVARDGYQALMKGESRIISGIKNKIYAAASTLMPDNMLAETMRKKMSPSDKEHGRENISHTPSAEEREHIERVTGKSDGDFEEHEDHIHNK